MIPRQFNIIPVKEKVPQIPWKEYTEREQTPEEKVKIQELCSNGNRIGIVTGPVSKIFVLDVDGKEGRESLSKYLIPRTATVQTPNDGMHYYFIWVPELDGKITTRTKILNGVDTRGLGGYVVHYGWKIPPHIAPILRPPQWLIDLLPNKEGQIITKTINTLASIKEGNRNASFTSLAGGLRSRGYKPEEIFELLKSKAAEAQFPENELRIICNSVGRYEPKFKISDGQGASVEEFLADSEPVEWICEPLIAKGAIGFVAGLPETGKTFILLDLAIECARGGGLWLGKFPVKGAKVLLIDQERAKSETQRRLKAIISGKQFSASLLKGNLFVRCGTTTRIDLQHSYEAFRKEITEIKPDLIIVDSLATFHTKEESNRMEIQQVMERIKEIRNDFGCSMLFVHHETKMAHQNRKDGGIVSYLDMSGNVAIPAAAETVFNVVQHDAASSMVHHTKNTLGTKVAPFMIQIRDIVPDKSKIAVEAY